MLSATGLHILHDSGAPDEVDYTTLVFVHGYGYHSGVFTKMIPYARKLGTRLILVNRRDYPGAQPYTEEARRQLSPGTADLDTLRSSTSRFMKDRALESAAFLAEFVQERTIPAAQPGRNAGGIVLVGWSMGGLWMTAFLAHISSSPHSRKLRQYVRRVVIYDTPSTTLGYARPPTDFDAFMRAMRGDRRALTPSWFSGYFAHGHPLAVDTLEYKTPLAHPPPTLSTLSPAERERLNARAPVARGGSDQILAFDGYRCGLFRELWRRALYLHPPSPSPSPSPSSWAGGADAELGAWGVWDDVEVRHVWCDMAFWESPHAALMLQAELADARARGARVRWVASVRLRGMNHFAHWTHPERTLQAFLAEEHGPVAIESSARARL